MGQPIACASLIAFVTLLAIRGGAESQVAAPSSVFDVASVRVNKSGSPRGGSMEFSTGGERFTATNVPLGALLLTAYNITVRQISVPVSFPEERYDVAAKTEHAASPDEMLRMLQALLVDRFRLVVHRDVREVPVYALVIGKGGQKLRESGRAAGEGTTPRIPSRTGGTEPGSGHLIFKDESMSDFAWALSRMAGIGDRVVVDNTGLKGTYDFELTFERDSVPVPAGDLRGGEMRLEGSSVFLALQEQLGLKLEAKKATVEFLIVDHVEKPSEN
jgi:uncharacterized protein (TIGR03435 family)